MLRYRLASCLAALAVAVPAVADGSIIVDCSTGQTIREMLADQLRKAGPVVLRVRGICREDVEILRDDVTLEGYASGATIIGSVTIDAARRAVLTNLTVTNPIGDGVTVENGGSATLRNNSIVDNAGFGIALRNAAYASVEKNILSRNGRANSQASGIVLGVGSTARGLENVMEGNANAGIEVGDNSTYRSDGDEVNALASGRASLDIYRGSYVELHRATVTGFVDLNQQSQLQVRNGSSVNGELRVSVLSFLRLRAGVLFTAPHTCDGSSICVTGR